MCGPRGVRLAGFTRTLWLLASLASVALAGDVPERVTDLAAVERVYAAHRIGARKPFEEALPLARIEQLVRDEMKKEATLLRRYGVAITPGLVEAEMKRIDSTTRAPAILAEIKAALGGDPSRFTRTVVRPLIVERELRGRFENDDAIHAPARRRAVQAREAALAARVDGIEREADALVAPGEGLVNDAMWLLTARPVDATAQITPPLPPEGEVGREAADQKAYFEDLPPELRRALAAQLQKPGDVSAVIETSAGFLVFLAKEKTAERLRVTSLFIRKRGYEEWLAEQPEAER